jgi:hypothetical protein
MLFEATPVNETYGSRYNAYCRDEACDSDAGSYLGASHDRHQQCGTTA